MFTGGDYAKNRVARRGFRLISRPGGVHPAHSFRHAGGHRSAFIGILVAASPALYASRLALAVPGQEPFSLLPGSAVKAHWNIRAVRYRVAPISIDVGGVGNDWLPVDR